jgi:hypothetical protein
MMAIQNPVDLRRLTLDKRELQRVVDEVNRQMGFVRDPTATVEKVRAMMLAAGIRPEDCEFSREIIRMRYPDDEV